MILRHLERKLLAIPFGWASDPDDALDMFMSEIENLHVRENLETQPV